MGVEIRVEFTGNKDVYKPDELVSGNVILNCSEAEDFEVMCEKSTGSILTTHPVLKLTLKGSAKVQWTEHHGSSSSTYTGKEGYFTETFILKSGGNGQKISSGRTSYPFQYKLPQNLPSSVEVQDGYIRYRAQVRLEKSFGSDKEQRFFTVIEEWDLNLVPNAKHPSTMEMSKSMCCWCCASGLIEGRINADKTGYVPGEYIVANASVENGSNTDLPECKLKIVQVAVEHANACGFKKSRMVRKTLNKQELPGKACPKHSSVTLDTQKIRIPPVPPSHQRNCKVIDIEYYLMLEVKTRKFSSNLRVMAPLELGTIPLHAPGDQPPMYPALSAQVGTTHEQRPAFGLDQQPTPSANPAPPPDYSKYMTSSFAPADPVNIPASNDGSATTYAPQYNYYDWDQSAFTYN